MDRDRFIRDRAPDEVIAAIDWLDAQRFQRIREIGGAGASFGNVALVHRRDGISVHIVRDRGQWTCDVTIEGVPGAFGLGLVAAARRGDVSWRYPPYALDRPVPQTWPEDLDWIEELAAGTEWIVSEPHAAAALLAESNRRSALIREHRGDMG